MPLPLGTRLDHTLGKERIVGVFCYSPPIELEPLRVPAGGSEAGNPFPKACPG